MFKKPTVVLFGVLLLFLSGCKKNEDVKDIIPVKESFVPVTIISAEISSFYEYGEYYGRTQGVNRASIIDLIGGRVESVAVTEGAIVKKGDSLGKISSEKAQIAFDSAKLNEKITNDNYLTLKSFLKSGNSSQINVDQAQLQWLNSKSQLIDAEKAYEGAFCISPIDGVVAIRNINKDDELMPGQSTFLIEDLSEIEITIGIPEADMKGIKEGSSAEVTLDLYPNRVWKGTLTRFSRRSSENNLTFSAVIVVDNSDRTILSGTTAKVKLLRNSFEESIVLPTDTVINDDGKNYVMVYKDGKVSKRDIVLGISTVERCVVLSGLSPGEKLVQEGLYLLVDSQEVTVIDEDI